MRASWGKTLSTTAGGDALEFRRAGPGIVWSPTQRSLLALWTELRGGDSLPSWDKIPVDDLADQRDTLMFLDVVDTDEARRFRIARLGKRIVRGYGGDFTGRFLDEAIPPVWRANAIQTYLAAIDSELPIYNVVDTLDRVGTLVRLERLLLPFSGAGGNAGHVLASIEASSIADTFDERQIGRSPHADASCALVAVIEV